MAEAQQKRVIFVCSHNSNRSIAAEAVARKERPDLIIASAGVHAAGRVNPVMASALEERGISTEGLYSKGVDHEAVGGLDNNWDKIILMGCLERLPVTPPNATVEDWGLPDPAADPSVIGFVIEEIKKKVQTL